MKYKSYYAILFIIVLLSCIKNTSHSNNETTSINGVIFDGPGIAPITESMFSSIDSTGINWMATTPEAFTYHNTLGVKSFYKEGQWYGETLHGSLKVIEHAKKRGLKVLMKPHIGFTYDLSKWDSPIKREIEEASKKIEALVEKSRTAPTEEEKKNYEEEINAFTKTLETSGKIYQKELGDFVSKQERLTSGNWRGNFEVKDSLNWMTWEKGYEKYILDCARIADSTNVDLFCIGTELSLAATKREQFWRTLIKKVKDIYSGPITYNANWDNYKNIKFWDGLDYIGISAYFPLSSKEAPTLEDAIEGWKDHKKDIKGISLQYNKPILFTEYGYKSVTYAAEKPWEEYTRINADEVIQADLYKALYQTFWSEEWFAGGFIWKWYYSGNGGNTSYSPQDKAAEKIMNTWYKKH